MKDVYGGIIDILMEGEGKIPEAIRFLKTKLQHLIDESVPMDKLVITKSLRSDYKNPMQIAHKVLADRMENVIQETNQVQVIEFRLFILQLMARNAPRRSCRTSTICCCQQGKTRLFILHNKPDHEASCSVVCFSSRRNS